MEDQVMEEAKDKKYCDCQGKIVDDDNMIGCDDEKCIKEWFHL